MYDYIIHSCQVDFNSITSIIQGIELKKTTPKSCVYVSMPGNCKQNKILCYEVKKADKTQILNCLAYNDGNNKHFVNQITHAEPKPLL